VLSIDGAVSVISGSAGRRETLDVIEEGCDDCLAVSGRDCSSLRKLLFRDISVARRGPRALRLERGASLVMEVVTVDVADWTFCRGSSRFVRDAVFEGLPGVKKCDVSKLALG